MKVSLRSGNREGEGETRGREGSRTEEKEGKRGERKRGVG
jgi:hypothetical protein